LSLRARATPVARRRLGALLATTLLVAGCGGSPPPGGERVNVLLVTLDTTRADHVGAYGADTVRTPALDRLAAEGVLFRDAVTSVPLTLPAHASIMTGSWPIDHGVHDNGNFVVPAAATTLAEILRAEGFATGAVLGAYVLDHSWGLDQGFDAYDDRFEGLSERSFGSETLQRDATEVADLALDWLQSHADERFFLWAHFYDPHFPYDPPEPFAATYPDRPYAGEVAYADAELGRILDHLRESGLDASTLVVVVGDHGEGLGQHGEPDHGIYLYQPTMQVPLIVRAPGGRPRGSVDGLARHVDLLPTVLDFLGLPIPAGLRGESLLPQMQGRAPAGERFAYGETFYPRFHYGWSELRSLRNGRYKYILAPRPELYDLEQDPGETFDRIDAHPGIAEHLAGELARLIAAESAPDDAAGGTIDPETLDRLRSLGYVGSIVTVPGARLADPKDRAASLPLFSRVAVQGPRALRERDYAAAIGLVDAALAVEPNYLDGYLIKAEALRKLERFAEAVGVLEAALGLNPDNVTTLHELAECHRALGGGRTTLDLVERIHAIAPGYPGAYLTAADVHREAGRPEEAIAALEALLLEQPENARAHYEIGRIRLERGELALAESGIRRAVGLDGRLFGARFNLALIAEQRGDTIGAGEEYLAELEQFPRNHEAWANLGLLRLRSGDAAAAEEAFGRLIELEPELAMGYVMLARARQVQGRVDAETLALVEQALELDPSLEPARQLQRQLRP